jgi:hypothetical protein
LQSAASKSPQSERTLCSIQSAKLRLLRKMTNKRGIILRARGNILIKCFFLGGESLTLRVERLTRFWSSEVLRFWGSEVLKFWGSEVLRFWSSEVWT